jgi:hypothetical protein
MGKMYLAETQSTRSRKELLKILCLVFSACSASLREKFLILYPRSRTQVMKNLSHGDTATQRKDR